MDKQNQVFIDQLVLRTEFNCHLGSVDIAKLDQ